MKKLKISTLWCGDFSQSVIMFLIKKISNKTIEFVHPSKCDILFIGCYELFSIKRKFLNYFQNKFKFLENFFPNIELYLLNRKIKPLRIYYSQENVGFPKIKYDFSITFHHNVFDKSHLRFPLWKELINWSHLDINRNANNFIKRFDDFYQIKDLMEPQGDEFIKKNKKICIFTSHFNEPRKSLYYFLSQRFTIDGYGLYFDKKIKHHNLSSFSKKNILKNYAFNLCPENSLYPGYYTEKVPEAFLSKALPLTWSDSSIKFDFNNKSFINLLDYSKDNFKEIMELLNDDIFLQKFTKEPLLLTKPNLDNEYKFIEQLLDFL
jgi:hypothetical protein